jgi:hypothetical protein
MFLNPLTRIIRNQEKIMAQIDDLNTAIAGVSTEIDAIAADVTTVLGLLKATTGTDLSVPIAALAAISTRLAGIDTSLKAVEPTPPTT